VARGTSPSLVRVGRIGRAHGVAGEVALHGSPLSMEELQEIRDFTWSGAAGRTLPLTLIAVRAVHGHLLATFDGYRDRNRALELTRGDLMVEPARLPDPGPGVAYTFQLIGLEVVNEDGRALGRLEDVIATGAHPIYVVRGERELLVPASPHVLRRVDLEAGVITVALPRGLEEI
jgi:16S rRNA processing protein RimM